MSAMEVSLFPLNTILYPGGMLPLKVFEQRYIEMTKACLSEGREFGVCMIKEGRETGTPAVPAPFGCLARITQWDMPQLGVFYLMTEGTQRFRVLNCSAGKNGLITGSIEIVPEPEHAAPRDPMCAELLGNILKQVGGERIPEPHRLDDACWVGYRLCELLPLNLELKQELLELDDPQERLARLSALLTRTKA
jgi:Lon protease-like protein